MGLGSFKGTNFSFHTAIGRLDIICRSYWELSLGRAERERFGVVDEIRHGTVVVQGDVPRQSSTVRRTLGNVDELDWQFAVSDPILGPTSRRAHWPRLLHQLGRGDAGAETSQVRKGPKPELDMDWIHPWIGLDWMGWLWPRFQLLTFALLLFLSNYLLWTFNYLSLTTHKSQHYDN